MSKKGTGKFFLGALIGAGLGVLFAPNKGIKTRQALMTKLELLSLKIKELDADEIKATFANKVAEISDKIDDLDQEKVLKFAKEKANDLQEQVEDLVALAKEKGTPVLNKVTEEIREKATEVVKEVLNRLEKKTK